MKHALSVALLTILFATAIRAQDAATLASTTPTSSAAGTNGPAPATTPSAPEAISDESEETAQEEPWDYSPYRVLLWIVSNDPLVNRATLEQPLRQFLDRQFASVWKVTLETAPASVAAVARRSLEDLNYESIAASDPVIAVKRNHPDAARIRFAPDLARYVKKILSTANRAEDIQQRIPPDQDQTLHGAIPLIENIEGDSLALRELWQEESTEAVLMSRGMAMTLQDPEAKIITPSISGMVAEATNSYDKIFVINIDSNSMLTRAQVIEFDTLQQVFGPVIEGTSIQKTMLISTIGNSIIQAFAPMVRIENAGQKDADGLLRAAGLILDKNSPAMIHPGDVLIPMVRKDDRNGKPISIGPLPWAFLLVFEEEMAAWSIRGSTDLQVGDRLAKIDDAMVEHSYSINKALHHSPLDSFKLEIARGGKSSEMAQSRGQVAALVPQFLGFKAVDKGSGDKQQTLVAGVMPESPADGVLQVGDEILSINKSPRLDTASIRQLIVSSKPEQAIELVIKRGDDTQNVSLTPTDASDLERRQSALLKMDFHSGRGGGLQGRNNKRTFRTALKARPFFDQTMIRMHVRGEPDEPLIGYEIYEKELNSKEMTFLGRTDWNGRIWLEKSENPLRLLYVKNGGAVLARLPLVPGQTPIEIAEMVGDDLRLQAEAYIRGVQNAIIDLIAIRELLGARIRLRLQKGEMQAAEELLIALRDQPTNEKIAEDMGKKQTNFLKILGNSNANQKKMIDQMFTTTRELLSKHINPKFVRDLEDDFIAAKKNGGKLPPKPTEEAAAKPAVPAAATPATPTETPAG